MFAGGFGLDAAEAVCADESLPRHQVLDLLDRLVSQSVVLTCEQENLPRYRMLETIRRYESGEQQRLPQRHRDFLLALATRLSDTWYGPGQAEALARLRAEHPNLLAALGLDADPQATLALATALRFHWCTGGFLGEGRRQLDRALGAAPEPTRARARALNAAAWVALLQGDHQAADRWLAEAGELAEELGDALVSAQVTGFRGSLTTFQGHMAEAVSLFKRAAAAQTAAEGEASAVFVLFQLAVAQTHLGDGRAADTCRRAIALAVAHGERWAHAHALWALGYDAWAHGDLEAALRLTRSGLEMERGFNDPLSAALMLETFAWITASRGDHGCAARLLGSVRAVARHRYHQSSRPEPAMTDRYAPSTTR